MRFRKRLKIAKGLYVNFSKSGASLTVGRGGLSVNYGSKGTYLNTGIPGTGLYNRQRIDGTTQPDSRPSSSTTTIEASISLDSVGKPVVKDFYGDIITDEGLLRKIKKTEQYKTAIESLSAQRKDEIESASKKFIEIFKLSPLLINRTDFEDSLANLSFSEYIRIPFSEKKPDLESCKVRLELKAKDEIKSIFFWTNKKKRNDYVQSNLHLFFEEKLRAWEREKIEFEAKEEEIKKEEDEKRKLLYEEQKKELENRIEGSFEYVHQAIENYLTGISLPVDFSIDYDYDSDKGALLVDLDLPEIEDLPQEKASTLSSGKLSIKTKSAKEIKQDYVRCVSGLAFFFAANFFNISTSLRTILISGYTQRVSKKTGNIEDNYIYSVIFKRDVFEKIDIENIDPAEAFSVFEHKLNLTSHFEMREIEPLLLL